MPHYRVAAAKNNKNKRIEIGNSWSVECSVCLKLLYKNENVGIIFIFQINIYIHFIHFVFSIIDNCMKTYIFISIQAFFFLLSTYHHISITMQMLAALNYIFYLQNVLSHCNLCTAYCIYKKVFRKISFLRHLLNSTTNHRNEIVNNQ